MTAPPARAVPILVRSRVYYGWVVLVMAAAAMVGTLPGRTQGLGLVTEPLLADLGIDRVSYAQLNLWATLIGSTCAIGIGRFIDRLGSRTVLTILALTLGATVLAMSGATSVWQLALSVTLSRGIGQSALSVVSLVMVGQWFVRRIDAAMAVYSVVMSVGFMVAFPLVGSLVQSRGWRVAWLSIGIALVAVLAPAAWVFVRRSPEASGLAPDGDGPIAIRRDVTDAMRTDGGSAVSGYEWRAALATPAFWVFALGAALYGLVASGIGLFNESILAERGFDASVYYQTLVVTAMSALAGNFLGGWLAGRMSLSRLLAASLLVLTGGLAALPHLRTLGEVLTWAGAMGLGGGLVMVLFFSIWPRAYGRRQLGRIQGSAQALTVLASAVGPLLLAWCVEWTGSYGAMFRILAGVIAVVAVSALFVAVPKPSDQPSKVREAVTR
jgi:MFS family permease